MRKIHLKSRKKLTAAVVTCAVVAGSAVGAAAAVKRTTGGDSRVLVVPVSEIAGGWWSDGGSAQGMAGSGTTQKIYAGGTETISGIRVKEGDTVRKGDVLLTYDAAKTNLELEKEKLDQQTIRLRIETAEKNLVTLSKLKPVSESVQPEEPEPGDTDGDGSVDEIPDVNGDTDDGGEPGGNVEIPDGDGRNAGQNPGKTQAPQEKPDGGTVLAGNVVLNRSLSSDASYFWREGDGTGAGSEGNPYRFLVSAGASVDGGFIRLLKGLKKNESGDAYFLLEIREGGSPAGKLVRAWAENASDLADVSDGWKSEIPKNGSFILPEKNGEEDEKENGGTAENPGTAPESPDDIGSTPESPDDIGSTPESPDDTGGDTGEENGSSAAGSEEGDKPAGAGETRKNELTSFSSVRTASSSASSDDSLSGGSVTLIPGDAQYSKEELADAKKEQQDTLRDLRLDYRESELKVKKAEQALSNCEVKASIDGIVRKAGDPNNPPNDGSPILEIRAGTGMTVQGGLSEDQYSQVKTGDTVTVQSYMSGMAYDAEITSISPYPDTMNLFGDSSKTWYPFTAVIQDETAEIEEGEWLSITFDNSGDMQDGGPMMLDQAFVRTDEGSPYVYIDENGTLKKQNVVLGKLQGGMYEIRSGLTQEDQIAFPYGRNTKDGAKTKQGTAEQIYSN
jgi:multidrug efflux pump subunit AcrA (membrane-fusion protein)